MSIETVGKPVQFELARNVPPVVLMVTGKKLQLGM